MANEIQELLGGIKDERLRTRLSAAIAELRKTKKFGLVFEEHLPELLPMFSAKVRSQSRVARRDGKLTETFIVQRVSKDVATVTPEAGGESRTMPVSELFVVKRFGEAIFPALRYIDSVVRADAAPHNTLIEADNFHALQLLEWLYAGKVDCIYIDPPYNTGAKDWKYNNDYVDTNDSWRHSKWLAFMERRLKLAKRLLNPSDSVLIVTIDEKEYSHLALLLDEVFSGAKIQMISSLINPASVARAGSFGRSDEYIFFVSLGKAVPQRVRLTREWVSGRGRTHTGNIRWDLLRRSGEGASRKDSPGCFYAIYVDPKGPRIDRVGDAIPDGGRIPKPAHGHVPVLPIRKDGSEGRWQWTPETLRERMQQGRVRITGSQKSGFVVSILKDGEFAKITRGEFQISGQNPDGSIVVEGVDTEFVLAVPASQWRISSHDSTQYGSRLLSDIIPGRRFPFPKSVYAVRDAIRFFVADKPDALVLDFFAGSGTTLNALALLNETDGGRRRCVLVTNNEVSDDEARTLRSRGLEPGHPLWEAQGICQSVTFPRCKAILEGKREDGTPLSGDYLMGLPETVELSRAFRSLDFITSESVMGTKAREALATSVGFPKSKVVPTEQFFIAEDEKVAVLLDPSELTAFIARGERCGETIETVYLPFSSGPSLGRAKEQIAEAWPPLTKTIEKKRAMSAGFATNLDYFRLDFLERSQVEVGGKLSDIVPALWMMAGGRGPIPKCKGNERMLLNADSPMAVLIDESAIRQFLIKLDNRRDIDWVFIVTNDQDSFSRLCEWLPDRIPANQCIHVWRNYIDNFLINIDRPIGSDGQ